MQELSYSHAQAGKGEKTAIHLSAYGFHNTLAAVNKGVSPPLLGVNDSAALTAAYVLQMMRLLIGL